MSFLPASEDLYEPAFMSEVLDLLCFEDDWQSSPTTADALCSRGFNVAVEEATDSQGDEKAPAKKMPMPTRKRKRPAHTRISSKHRIAALRQEVTALEAELACLQLSTSLTALTSAPPQEFAGWEDVAMHQSLERERAEAQNQILRSQLAKQYAATKSLSCIVHDWDRWTQQSAYDLLRA